MRPLRYPFADEHCLGFGIPNNSLSILLTLHTKHSDPTTRTQCPPVLSVLVT